jgi:hypothetical protein
MNMNKPKPTRSLSELAHGFLAETFKRQGFASTELVTRWPEIVGLEIAAHAEPLKLQWPRTATNDEPAEPATLVLRVEGPAAIEIQHQSGVILERINRFFGWQAVGRLALRQAPLKHRAKPSPTRADREAAERVAATLTDVDDESLRMALGRLGAAVKRP